MKKLQSKIIASPEWPRIKEAIEANLGKKSHLAIYKIVLGIDPNIGHYNNFHRFLIKWTKELATRQDLAIQDPQKNNRDLLQDINDEAISNVELMEESVKVAISLGDIIMAKTLEEVEKKIKSGKPIALAEKKMIMRWWSEAGSMVFAGEMLKLKSQSGKRETFALGLLARAAMSGNLKKEDFRPIEGEVVKEQINEPQTTT